MQNNNWRKCCKKIKDKNIYSPFKNNLSLCHWCHPVAWRPAEVFSSDNSTVDEDRESNSNRDTDSQNFSTKYLFVTTQIFRNIKKIFIPGVNYCSTKSLLLFILLIFLSIKIRNKDVTLFFPFEIGCRKFTGTLKFRIENKQMLNFNADGLKVSEWRKLHNVIPPLHCLVIRNWEPNVFHSFHPSEGNFRRGCCLCLHYC